MSDNLSRHFREKPSHSGKPALQPADYSVLRPAGVNSCADRTWLFAERPALRRPGGTNAQSWGGCSRNLVVSERCRQPPTRRRPLMKRTIYRSATKRLIEARRGKQFQMVEDENASYGFRRNTFGLRPAAVGISAVAAVTTGLIWYAALAKPLDLTTFAQSVTTYPYLPILLATDLVYMAIFIFLINRHFVRQAADEYALALLRTLDQKRKL